MADGLRNSLSSGNAEPLNFRSGVPQTVVAKRSRILATAIIEQAPQQSRRSCRPGLGPGNTNLLSNE